MLQQFLTFKGEIPRMAARQLPDEYASRAVNCRMESGALEPVNGLTFHSQLEDPAKTLFKNGTSFLAYDAVVEVLPGPTATERLYVFGDGIPTMQVGNDTYPLALPAPDLPPTVANLIEPNADTIETILYAFTYVTIFNEESAPSPLSEPLDWSYPVVVRISDIAAPPAGRGIDRIRVYRSSTSATGISDLYYAFEIPYVDTVDHSMEVTPLNEPVSTNDHDTPPDDLRGVISMPNGMMVGHTDREIFFCEPYQPHAWPTKYSLLVDYDIVGLAAFGSQLAVMTRGTPYRGAGSHPDTFQLERIEELLPCLSAQSIVDLGYAAAYASTDGLVTITGTGAQLISKPLFTTKQWHRMDPQTIRAAGHKGRYVFAFDGSLPTGDETFGLIDLSGDQPFFLRGEIKANALFADIRSGTLYFQDNTDNAIYVWDDLDTNIMQDLEWTSPPIDTGFPVSFAAVYVEGTAHGPFSCTVYADGAEVGTITELNTPKRLKARKSQHWHMEITGRATIDTAALATSLSELAALR